MPPQYATRDPTKTVLYELIAEHRATFAKVASDAGGAPSFVDESVGRFLRCGVLAHGFARFGCSSCPHEHLVSQKLAYVNGDNFGEGAFMRASPAVRARAA